MPKHCKHYNPKPTVTRRDFLRMAGVGAAGLLLQSCQSRAESLAPLGKTSGSFAAQVAVGQAQVYDRDTIERQVFDLIDGLGGLGDVVTPGDTVAIKTNLTGGVESGSLPGIEPYDSFVTHPEVVRALTNAVKAAVAQRLTEAGSPPKVLTAGCVVGRERASELFEAAYDEHAHRLAQLFANVGERREGGEERGERGE